MTPMRLSVEEHEKVGAAIDLMTRSGSEQLPVTRQGKVAGSVSARDLHAATFLARHDAARLQVRDLCPALVYVAQLDEPLDQVLLEMADRQLASAVVVDAQGSVVGVFTAATVCYLCGMSLRGRTPPGLHLPTGTE
jgi:CBS domain-containing protein